MIIRSKEKQERYTDMFYKLKDIRDFSNTIQKIYGQDDLMYKLYQDVEEYMKAVREMLAKDLK